MQSRSFCEYLDDRAKAALDDFFKLVFGRRIETGRVANWSVFGAALREFIQEDALDSLDQVALILGFVAQILDDFLHRLDGQKIIVARRKQIADHRGEKGQRRVTVERAELPNPFFRIG